jgi:hypothetical protein
MLYTTVFMVVAIASFLVVSDLQTSEIPLQQNTVAKETGDNFVSVLTLAVKGGEGFSYNYTFPRTVFGRPYKIDLRGMSQPSKTILLEWEGDYGNFSYQYGLPPYSYTLEGGCLAAARLDSSACSNLLVLQNDGDTLKIIQSP